MFNARIKKKNFGGQRSMLTKAPTEPDSLQKNIDTMKALLQSARLHGTLALGGTTADLGRLLFTAIVCEARTPAVVDFLRNYRWLEADYKYPERPADTTLQIEFLEKEQHGISSWLVIAPQRGQSFGDPLPVERIGAMTVKQRKRVAGRGYQVFGEPAHRTVSEYLSGISPGREALASPKDATTALLITHRAVLSLYPVRPQSPDQPSVGFELFFPDNNLPFEAGFTVRRKGEDSATVQAGPGD
jgi:hypothetical protein